MRLRRWLVGAAFTTSAVLSLSLLAGAGFAYWVSTPSGNAWLKRTVVTAVNASMVEGAFEIDVLRTDLLSNLDVEGLRIVDGLGTPLIDLPSARARFDLTSLLTGPLHVWELEARGLRLVLDNGEDRLRLAELFGPPSGSTEPFSLPFDLVVDRALLTGTQLLIDESVRLEGGHLSSRLETRGPVFDLPNASLCAHLVVPGPIPLCATGPVVWDGVSADLTGVVVEGAGSALALEGTAGSEMNLTAHIGRLDLAGIDPVAARAGLQGTLGGRLRVAGPFSELAISGELSGMEGTKGSLIADVTFWIEDPISWEGSVQTLGVDVAQLYDGTPMPVVLDGTLTLDAEGVRYPDDLDLTLAYTGRVDADDTYHLRDVVFDGNLDEGTLHVTRGDFDGVAGPLGATGTIDLVKGPLRLKVEGDLSAAQITELGIEGLLQDGTADLVVTSNLKAGDGRFQLGGHVDFAPFQYTEDVTLERLRADVSGWTRGGDLSLRVGLDGANGSAYGVRFEGLGAEDLVVSKKASGLTVQGPMSLLEVSQPSVGRFATVEAGVDVSLPTEGEREIHAALGLGPFDLQTFLGSGGNGQVDLMGDAVGFDVALDDGGRAFLRTAGTYQLDTSRLKTSRFEVRPTPRLSWTSNGPIALTVVDGGLADSRISLRGSHGDLDVSGDLASTGDVNGKVRAINLQLDALAELFPDSFSGLSGVLILDAEVEGPATAPLFSGRFDVDGLWVEDQVRWLDLHGTFEGGYGQLSLDTAFARAGEPLGTLVGRVPMMLDLANPGLAPERDADLRLALLPGPLARLNEVAVAELDVPDGTISAQLAVTGALLDPDLVARGVVETAVGSWRDPGRVEFDVHRRGPLVDGRVVVREGMAHRAVVDATGATRMNEVFASVLGDGAAPDTSNPRLWLDDMLVSAVLEDVPANSLLAAMGNEQPLTGTLDGTFVASGDPLVPVLQGDVRWSNGTIGDVVLDDANVAIRSTDDGLTLTSAARLGEGTLGVNGRLPVVVDLGADAGEWIRGPLDLTVDGAKLPLGLASLVEGVAHPAGTFEVDGTVKGTFAEPDLDLQVAIDEGRLDYEPLGLALSDITVRAKGQGRRLKIEQMVARSQPLHPIGLLDENRASLIQVTGAANVEKGALAELSAAVVLKDAWVMGTYDTAMRVGGSVRMSGAWPALNVDGKLDLVNGRYVYRSDDAVVAAPLQPTEQLVIHRNGTPFMFRAPAYSPVYEQFDIDLGINLKRNLEVVAVTPFFDDLGQLTASLTQANINSRIGGEVQVGLNDDASWRVGGEVDVVDGTIQVLRSKFRLDSGTITLVPYDVSTSPLDLSATSNIQDVTVDLRITGTVGDPSLSTTADGYDETQVMVMLLTGQSVDGLTGNQGQAAQQSTAMAAAALLTSTVFSGSAAGALSIEADGSIRVGAPWSSTVFSELVLRPFADSDENVVSLALEWALIRKLLLEAGAGDRYQWADISWETRF